MATTRVRTSRAWLVDSNPLSFTDPDTTAVQADGLIDPATGQGNVYVTYHTDWDFNGPSEHGNSVMLMGSHDGGLNFSTASAANDSPWMLQDAVGQSSYPRMAVSQGTADGRVQPGQLTVVWDDYTHNTIWTDRVQDGVSASEFTNWSGPFVDPLAPLGGVYYTINVNITDPTFVLSDFDTTLNMVLHGSMTGVMIDLEAPNSMRFALANWSHRTIPWNNTFNLGGAQQQSGEPRSAGHRCPHPSARCSIPRRRGISAMTVAKGRGQGISGRMAGTSTS